MKDQVLKQLEQQRLHYARQLRNIEAGINKIKNGELVEYLVQIFSLWSDNGEETVTATDKDLTVALNEASKSFLKTNKRSDIQGGLLVSATVNKITVILPETLFEQDLVSTSLGNKVCIGFKLKES